MHRWRQFRHSRAVRLVAGIALAVGIALVAATALVVRLVAGLEVRSVVAVHLAVEADHLAAVSLDTGVLEARHLAPLAHLAVIADIVRRLAADRGVLSVALAHLVAGGHIRTHTLLILTAADRRRRDITVGLATIATTGIGLPGITTLHSILRSITTRQFM